MIARSIHCGEEAVSESGDKAIETIARRRITRIYGLGICFCDVSISYEDNVLTLQGRLPSFYAKQLLQTMLKEVDGVKQIDNQTDVVSSTGLSSARRYQRLTSL